MTGAGGRRITRGFLGRGQQRDRRLPPGQYDAGNSWPLLTAEATPTVELADWSFTVEGLVRRPTSWTWDEVQALPQTRYEGPIHCVTAWSKLDMRWEGVSLDELLGTAAPLPTATHVVAYSHTGYTTNLRLDDVRGSRAWLAHTVDGGPLPREHGGPARLLVPHLYFWKSAKWVAGLRVLDHDERGFWELHGYHDRGDPWLEQRYRDD